MVRSVQRSGSLQLIVRLPTVAAVAEVIGEASSDGTVAAPAPALTEDLVSITDLFGTAVPVATIRPLAADDGLFHIEAITPPPPPGADAPAYRLSVAGASIWFAPDAQGHLADGAGPVQPPPGKAGINYLGRDYAAFTALMRARVAQIVGQDSAWALDHPADPMTTIIEALAYTADHLSFRQDAAGTESYLPTARHRLSLRRHARLRDYAVNDGCNARTALVFTVKGDGVIRAGLKVVTQQPGILSMALSEKHQLIASTTVFETMVETPVSLLRNNLAFALARAAAYTLPKGAIQAQLNSAQTGLVPGQLIAFVQTTAPVGATQPFGAQVVRVLTLEPVKDNNGTTFATLVTWHPEDALTEAMTVAPQGQPGMVQLYGNVALADHGETIDAVLRPDTVPTGRRYRPMIEVEDPISACPPPAFDAAFAAALDPALDPSRRLCLAALMVPSARATLAPDPGRAALAITMKGERPGMAKAFDVWHARADLLASPAAERAFAAAGEDGYGGDRRHLFLRFGDGVFGAAPAPGTRFLAKVRVGAGQSGRVSANALVQIVDPPPLISWVTNPLPAAPVRAELNESVRLFAATSFRTNLRGIEPGDWERIAHTDPLVAHVSARVGDDGYAPCVIGLSTIETVPPGASFAIASARLMEHAVLGAPPTIEQGVDVPILITLVVCCWQGTNIVATRERLLQWIGGGARPDGGAAHFNAVAWPLGRSVLLDELVALLRSDGAVHSVITDPTLDPRIEFRTINGGDTTCENIAAGRITIRPYERARAENDPFHPEFGLVRLYLVVAP